MRWIPSIQYLALMLILSLPAVVWAQPANDDCSNAQVISIPNSGYGLGFFVADTVDLSGATLEFGEYVSPLQVSTDDKSVWYEFTIATTREVAISIYQPGTPTFGANAVGWTLFRTGSCLPGATEQIDPPIVNIEGYTHQCLSAGNYKIQVSAQGGANDSIGLSIDIRNSTAGETNYDFASGAYDFGVVSGTNPGSTALMNETYEIGCQSHYLGEPLCPDNTYAQTTWHTFTTDNFVDHIRFEVRENPWNSMIPAPKQWGYTLYQGDVKLDSIADGNPANGENLTVIESCDTLRQFSSGSYANTFHNCQLNPNTTYSIQLMSPEHYAGRIDTRMYEVGAGTTAGADLNAIPASNQMGVLPMGATTSVSDVFACNADMSNYAPCGTDVIPASGVHTINSRDYDLNTWFTFEVSVAGHVRFNTNAYGPNVGVRLYAGNVSTDGCGGLSLFEEWRGNRLINCLPAGEYSVQILGYINPPSAHQYNTHLGRNVNLSIETELVAEGQYGLHTAADIEDVNGGVAMPNGVTVDADNDFMDCRTTVLPAGDHCQTGSQPVDRAIYRRVEINQNGILVVGGGNWRYLRYRLYRGDAATAPVSGGELTGLVDQGGCQRLRYPMRVCVTPGTYTLVTFGQEADITRGDDPWFRFETFASSAFFDPGTPEVLPTLSTTNTTVTATPVQITCDDNPLDILGNTPCSGATKQIYREVFLDDDLLVEFDNLFNNFYRADGFVRHRIFSGRISDDPTGFTGLSSLYRDCFTNFEDCMPAGWYTIVTYTNGEDFVSPEYTSGRGEHIGSETYWRMTVDPDVQQYGGLILDADEDALTSPIFWEPTGAHTPAYPQRSKSTTLDVEHWDCADNLPLPAGITPCNPSDNRVSFRVFELTKPSYLLIDGIGARGKQSRLYQGDLRAQTPPFTIEHDCITNDMRICATPGTYTLVTFADDDNIGRSFNPRIYVDSLGTSKYDNASDAYDFGLLPNDSTEYLAAPGAPLDALGRPASNDFFFCSTGAQSTDVHANCPVGSRPPANALPSPTNPLRNLWYTFEVNGPGRVHVSVYNRTPDKGSRSPFTVYRMKGGTGLPIDSTSANLEQVATSTTWWCGNYQSINFFRDPCTATGTDRYVVVVNNHRSNEPNVQVEVGVRFAPVSGGTIAYDHVGTANSITANPTTNCNGPYFGDTLTPGTYTGCEADLTCATRDVTDQVSSCHNDKTVWYTFASDFSGRIRVNYDRILAGNTRYNANDIRLFRQVIPGDTSSASMVRVPLTNRYLSNPDYDGGASTYWGDGCLQPGRYYLMITGCTDPTETVVPRIWTTETEGDLCGQPGEIVINAPGTFTETLTVDCHTIGEGPGEDGTNMGCLGLPTGFKSQWVRVEVNTTDTVDIDIRLIESTDVTGGQIRYRVGSGDCSNMSFDNCVEEGTFIELNLQCRLGGDYWIHSIVPENATGTIDYEVTLTPVVSADCEPIDPDAPEANFDYTASCFGTAVTFDNQSTQGDSIDYFWDFGDGITSTAFEPIHNFAVPDTYAVTHIVNSYFEGDTLADTLTRQIIIQPVPNTLIGGPTTVTAGQTFTLNDLTTNANTDAVYYWNFCSGGPCEATPTTYIGQTPPPLTFELGGVHTVCLTVYNGSCDSTYCLDIDVEYEDIFTGGPYDGHSMDAIINDCRENIWAGGPYDGHSSMAVYESCEVIIWAGGPYDGHGSEGLIQDCRENIFAGGPYDGHSQTAIYQNCTENIFAGGPYDGHGSTVVYESCTTTTMWAGGPYDGHSMAFDSVCPVPEAIFAGGPYDGHGSESLIQNCVENIWVGGPYDGHGSESLIQNCVENIWAGGPYDGHSSMAVYESCEVLIWAGGPYDGHSSESIILNCVENIWAGGPYDGHGSEVLYCDKPNIFAGGPYDGADIVSRLAASANGDTVCPDNPATLTANSPVDWYTVPTGGAPIATNTDTYVTPPLDYTRIYYIDGGCGGTPKTSSGGRTPVIAHVLGRITPLFDMNPACETEPVNFYNQTTVSGTANASISPTSTLTTLGTTGLPATPGTISFSSGYSSTPNYSRLRDGVHDETNAWRGGSAAASSTQWIQLHYVSQRSVRRFYYWNATNLSYQYHSPRQLRLYFADGGGWNLVKVFTPPYPDNGIFDTGLIGETTATFANRWKIEVDVEQPNAPTWGEFQVFDAGPTIGGDLTWDFGDGSPPSSDPNPTHVYPTAGSYNVTLDATAPGCCSDPLTLPIDICPLTPLAVTSNQLNGVFIDQTGDIQLDWNWEGNIAYGQFEKLVDGAWAPLANFVTNPLNTVQTLDKNVIYNDANIYRVTYFDYDGAPAYSNTVTIQPSMPLAEYMRLFPNPTDLDEVNVSLQLAQSSDAEVTVYDKTGRLIFTQALGEMPKGVTTAKVNISDLAAGVYVAKVNTEGNEFVQRFVKLR